MEQYINTMIRLTKRTVFRALAALLLGFGSVAQAATTRYADNHPNMVSDCTTGNYSIANRNCTGTAGNAYRDWRTALASTVAGDTIIFRSGTYSPMNSHNYTVNSGDSWFNPITWKRYLAEVVIIHSTVTVSNGGDSVISLAGDTRNPTIKYIVIDGLILEGEGTGLQEGKVDNGFSTGTNAGYIRFINGTVRHVGRNGVATNSGLGHNEFINLDVHHVGEGTTTSGNPAGHAFYNSVDFTLIEGCNIHDNPRCAIQIYSATNLDVVNKCTIRNNVIANNGWSSGGGITIDGDDNQIYENLITDNMGRGIVIGYGPSNRTIVYNNVCYNNTGSGIMLGSFGSAAYTTIKNNIFSNNGGWGIDLGTVNNNPVSNTTFTNNTFYQNVGGTWIIRANTTGTVESNNLTSNPLFVSPPSNFTLQSGSPAIDAGTATICSSADVPVRCATAISISGYLGTAPDHGASDQATGGAVPAAPSSLTATKDPTNNYYQINLVWTNVANEPGYKIERKKGVGGSWAQIATTALNDTAEPDATCGSGTTYYYRVRAYNASGNSGYSPEANATTDEVTSGRRAHWKLDATSGTTAIDSSGNGNTGALTSFPASPWVPGQVGGGLNFDGVDDRVNALSGATLDNLVAQGGGGMTVSAWIKADTMGEAGLGRIVDKTTAIGPVNGWALYVEGTNSVSFIVDHGTTDLYRISTANAITTGAWRHVLVTWNGSTSATNAKIYVNGAQVSYAMTTDGVGARASDATANLSVGNDSAGVRTFDGVLDDVRVYNRVLSTNEIQAVYRAGL